MDADDYFTQTWEIVYDCDCSIDICAQCIKKQAETDSESDDDFDPLLLVSLAK